MPFPPEAVFKKSGWTQYLSPGYLTEQSSQLKRKLTCDNLNPVWLCEGKDWFNTSISSLYRKHLYISESQMHDNALYISFLSLFWYIKSATSFAINMYLSTFSHGILYHDNALPFFHLLFIVNQLSKMKKNIFGFVIFRKNIFAFVRQEKNILILHNTVN